MAKVQCYNCKRTTPVVAPHYRCKFCNYPLNKYVEQDKEPEEEVIIEKIKQDEPEKLSINDIFRQQQQAEGTDIKTVMDKLKPDEKIKSTPTGAVILKQNLNKDKDKQEIVAGWLVVHTENRLPVTYELYPGDNVIGRPDGPHHVDIRVEDDEYVSRVHSIIRITKDMLHRFHYQLLDNGTLRGGVPSTNGTYINGIPERLSKHKVVYLRDGDTVQVGMTKMVFKNTDSTMDDSAAVSSVHSTDYTATVAIKL